MDGFLHTVDCFRVRAACLGVRARRLPLHVASSVLRLLRLVIAVRGLDLVTVCTGLHVGGFRVRAVCLALRLVGSVLAAAELSLRSSGLRVRPL